LQTAEIDAFVAIGRHLATNGIPVPKIYLHDRFSGIVFIEDLGDTHLQTVVRQTRSPEDIFPIYQKIIRLLVSMFTRCSEQFDPTWSYQSPEYEKNLILEKECRYFVSSFLHGYLNSQFQFADFEEEFLSLATKAVRFGINGFMHRDFQSRNIMAKGNRYYVIDFQGGRIGPIQYDLASLLIDPYADLPVALQQRLLVFCSDLLSSTLKIDRDRFSRGYQYCAITRNLQILGAFGYLTRVKRKSYFADYIPTALKTLKRFLDDAEFPMLRSAVTQIISAKATMNVMNLT
jgi:aminoglycoside/choline kinase family phosphotransferase